MSAHAAALAQHFTLTDDVGGSDRTSVFRGIRHLDRAPIIVKSVRSDYPTALDLLRLRHEHAMLDGLDLPGVVRSHGLVPVGNGVGLVLEDLGNRSLFDVLREGRPSVAKFLELALALARIVESLHRRQILHKDIKSEHFLVDDATGSIKLIDFGLATRLSREAQPALLPTHLEGTFAYMAPEQTGRMNRIVDHRSDLYSLGVTLYELLTGSLPFTSADPLELVHSHIARTPAPPHELRAEVPEVVSGIVSRLLAKVAEDRYQDAGGLIADLELCAERLAATGRIDPFPLGERDLPETLRIPQKLYGREAELETLQASFLRAKGGGAELLLIKGPSGVGKSAVVHELQKQLVRKGRFVGGKFDQLNRAVPYAPIACACRELLASILSEPPGVLGAWAARLREAVGPNGAVIADLVPELELVLGKQRPALELGPTESQHRFERVFLQFVQVFTSAAHPLVLFLDDLQWADTASLRLLRVLMTAPNRGYLLVLGAYRDNEVGPTHELSLTLDELRASGAAVSELTIAPLGRDEIETMLVETLGGDAPRVAPLAALALRKTSGNPFFLSQFLMTLHDRGLLALDRQARLWSWDLARVEEVMVTDNVVDLLLERLHRLSGPAQEVLRLASCVGHRFDLETLAAVAGRGTGEMAADLWEPLREGLLVPLDDSYRFASEATDQAPPNVSYRFLHDRVQQAAYALIDPARRSAVHLQMGRLLLARSGGNPADDILFDVVGHLNQGAALLTDPAERAALARFDLRAGCRARDSAAHDAALTLLARCTSLLGDDPWRTDYDVARAATYARAECAAASGKVPEAFALLDLIAENSRPGLDRAMGGKLRIGLLTQINRMHEAVAAGIETAGMLDLVLPSDRAALGPAIQAEFGAIQEAVAGRSIESLADLPHMTDPHALATTQMLAALIPSSFQQNQDLYVLIVLKAISLAIRHGNPPEAAHFFASYGIIYGVVTGDREAAYRLASVGVALGDRPRYRARAGAAELMFSMLLSHWRTHVSESLTHFRHGMRASLETGDHLHLGYCASIRALMRFFCDGDLADLTCELGDCKVVLGRSGHPNVALTRLLEQGITNLQQDRHEELDEVEQRQLAEGNPWMIGVYLTLQLMTRYVAGDHAGALAAADAVDAVSVFQIGMLWSVDHVFYRAMARAGLARATPIDERGPVLEALARDEERLRELVGAAPANHAHRLALVGAELAALTGLPDRACDEYDRAIAVAHANGFVHHEAMANELCGAFHFARGRANLARGYLMEAHYGYQRWGATAKVRSLVARHPELRAATQANVSATATSTVGGLDLATAVRVSQTIASELSRDRLIERLMRALVEHAGAQRGFLIVSEADRLQVTAAVTVDPDEVRLAIGEDLDRSEELSAALVHYVARSRDAVVLGEATTDLRFGRDPYVQRTRPKSVLCVPMVHQGRVIGVLYLENNAAAGIFDPARLGLLQFLAAQAAIAIENVTLYEQLERRVEERTAALATANGRLQENLEALAAAQRRLIDMSRAAGRADVAISILHNVGNVLNSVNVSVGVIAARVQKSRAVGIEKVAQLLTEHRADLGRFLTEDDRGRRVPDYLSQLAGAVAQERVVIDQELTSVTANLDRINGIVAMQQAHAAGVGMAEAVSLPELLDGAIDLHVGGDGARQATVVREYGELPVLMLDRHAVLQIVVNLLNNARTAIAAVPDGQITVRCALRDHKVVVSVEDNGAGVSAEELPLIFNRGVKLHGNANTARELGGELSCVSQGRGAQFTLVLPARSEG